MIKTTHSMRTHSQWLNYQKLELISEQSIRQPQHSAVWAFLTDLWHLTMASLTNGVEPYIWQTRDRQGNLWWMVYDAIAQKTIRFASADEVLIWLETRFSNRSSNRSGLYFSGYGGDRFH
jgi:hypothetical protein